MFIREIEEKDNKKVEALIRECLIEYEADHEGTAWTDPDLGDFSYVYNDELNKYWVCVDENDEVIAGVGIKNLEDGFCELQKMYCKKEFRGTGIANELITIALNYAKKYYKKCCLETLSNMTRARKFYEKHGFHIVAEFVIDNGHFACDVLYAKDL